MIGAEVGCTHCLVCVEEEHEISIDLTGLPETESSSPEVDWLVVCGGRSDEGRVGRKVRASR